MDKVRTLGIAFFLFGLPLLLLGGYFLVTHPADAGARFAACFEAGDAIVVPLNESCARDVVRALLEKYEVRTVLAVLDDPASPEVVVKRCHAIGHIIGEENYFRAGSIESALSACSAACRNACTHGVVGAAAVEEIGMSAETDDIAHADKETILAIGKKYCTSSAMCHAVGHILYAALRNYPDALAACESVGTNSNAEYCYQGVFMESIGNDESLVVEKPADATNLTYPCAGLAEKYSHACYRNSAGFQNPILEADGNTAPENRIEKVAAACAALDGHEEVYCFEGIGFNYWRYFADHQSEAASFCGARSGESRDSCILGIVVGIADFSRHDDAAALCSLMNERSNFCFGVLFQLLEERSSISRIEERCTAWGETCRSAFSEYRVTRPYLPVYQFGLYGEPAS